VNREQLLRAVKAATIITEESAIIVIGSQSILGTWDETVLPEEAVQSMEVDMCPLDDDDSERLANRLDEHVGYGSDFSAKYGFYIDGVGKNTAILPDGWDSRLAEVGEPGSLGLCLDPHDLCVAKMVANRDKDRVFVTALVAAGLIDSGTLFDRLAQTELTTDQRVIAEDFAGWLAGQEPSRPARSASETPRVSDADREVRAHVRGGVPIRSYRQQNGNRRR